MHTGRRLDYGPSQDAAQRRVPGDDVEIVLNAYDECNTVIPVKRIIRRFRRGGNRGLVCLVGVQTSQFPRATHQHAEVRPQGSGPQRHRLSTSGIDA